MGQYSTGVVDITNGSATVSGIGTVWTTNATAGDIFIVQGDAVSYTIASVTNDTTLQLTANYAGVTDTSANYTIHIDFTAAKGIPLLAEGDVETSRIFSDAMLLIDTALAAVDGAVLQNGTTPLTANWDVGGFEISNVGVLTTAELEISSVSGIHKPDDTGFLHLSGGNSVSNGANIELYGGSHATAPSYAVIDANKHFIRSQLGSATYVDIDATYLTSYVEMRIDVPYSSAVLLDARGDNTFRDAGLRLQYGGNKIVFTPIWDATGSGNGAILTASEFLYDAALDLWKFNTGVTVAGAFTVTGVLTSNEFVPTVDGIHMGDDISTLILSGGFNSTNGANIELYGGTHGTYANDMFIDADTITFRNQNNTSIYGVWGASGRLLVNEILPRTVGSIIPQIQLSGTNPGNSFISSSTYSTDASFPSFGLAKSRSATAGSFVVINNGDTLGEINWFGDDGTSLNSTAARITGKSDGAPSTGIVPGSLEFATANTSGTLVTAVTIDSSQHVVLGGTVARQVASGIQRFQVEGVDTATSGSSFTRYSNNNAGVPIYLGKSRGATSGSYTAVQTNDVLGYVIGLGADGTDLDAHAALMKFEVGSAPSTGIVPGRIVFQTANTSGVLTNALTLDSSQNSTFNGVIYHKSYTVATLPSATTAGGMIYVSDETGGATMAFSDGTNWRRVQDRAIVA